VNDWHQLAACRGRSGWFASDAFAVAVAQRVCAGCPVRPQCAATALALFDDAVAAVGVWAGVRLRGYRSGTALAQLRQVAKVPASA
jgi:hypothetical protein